MRHILVVDDDPVTRAVICRNLEKWGYKTASAENGVEALKIVKIGEISFVISDWMMPEMDGLELCREIRKADLPHYVYIILLTAKSDKTELVKGMETGADDFIAKPFNKRELQVRINAGIRILNLERNLEERNQKLENAYSIIRKDLQAAAKMQIDLLPDTSSTISGIKFDWLFLPCTFVAGDIFNFFRLDKNHIGFYILDVAGHGIPSAMLSFSLSKMFTAGAFGNSESQECFQDSAFLKKMLSPANTLHELNNRFQVDIDSDSTLYFTMSYGIVDLAQSKVRLSQAGQPPAILIKHNNEALFIGEGGVPIGMFPDIKYEEYEFDFTAGDRLFVYSDGITECTNQMKCQFSQEKLLQRLSKWQKRSLSELLSNLKEELHNWRSEKTFNDDVSIMAMECAI
ncbi:MAG: SpoIIE family protein phosphatase [bacterium]